MSADEVLVCAHEPDFPVAALRVAGPLSLATVPDLRRAGLKALTDQPELLLIDVAGLVAVDDITLTVFPMLARQGTETGTDVMLVGAGSALHAQLDRMGIARQVPAHGTAGEAVAAHARLPGPLRQEADFEPVPEATAAARELVDGACAQWRITHLADVAALIVTELVANAIEHAGTPMRVTVALRTRHLHIAVRDASPLPLRRSAPDDEDTEPGRGLLIVEAMATSLGCMRAGGGKVVWATLPARPKR